jgi:hypothetical protein
MSGINSYFDNNCVVNDIIENYSLKKTLGVYGKNINNFKQIGRHDSI